MEFPITISYERLVISQSLMTKIIQENTKKQKTCIPVPVFIFLNYKNVNASTMLFAASPGFDD